jgi:hypothetical protein
MSSRSWIPIDANSIRRYLSLENLTRKSHISNGVKLQWELIPNARDVLLSELESMYWNGVKRELKHITLTLKAWEQPELANTVLEDEINNEICGFDTFIDQVNEDSRDFALQYGQFPPSTSNSTFRLTFELCCLYGTDQVIIQFERKVVW